MEKNIKNNIYTTKKTSSFVTLLVLIGGCLMYEANLVASSNSTSFNAAAFSLTITQLQSATIAFEAQLTSAYPLLLSAVNGSSNASSWTPSSSFTTAQTTFYNAIMNCLNAGFGDLNANSSWPDAIKLNSQHSPVLINGNYTNPTQSQIISHATTIAVINFYLSANQTINPTSTPIIPTPYGQDPSQYFFGVMASIAQSTNNLTIQSPNPLSNQDISTNALFSSQTINPIEMAYYLNGQFGSQASTSGTLQPALCYFNNLLTTAPVNTAAVNTAASTSTSSATTSGVFNVSTKLGVNSIFSALCQTCPTTTTTTAAGNSNAQVIPVAVNTQTAAPVAENTYSANSNSSNQYQTQTSQPTSSSNTEAQEAEGL